MAQDERVPSPSTFYSLKEGKRFLIKIVEINFQFLGLTRQTPTRQSNSIRFDTTTAPTLASFIVEMVESTALELSSSLTSGTIIDDNDHGGVAEPPCTHISEAIKAQGIDDLTRFVFSKSQLNLIDLS